MEQRHRVADDAGGLDEGPIGGEALGPHVPQDPAMDWLQPVSSGWDCTIFDDRSRVGEVVAVELVPS